MVDDGIAEAVAPAFVVLTGNAVRDRRFHGPSCHFQLHFDLLASPKLLAELATLVALVAIAAIWADEGLAGSAATALCSASTDDFTALVWLEKSLLPELTSAVASLWIFVTCDFSALTSPLETELASALRELSRLLQSEQYAGLLPPLLAAAPLPAPLAAVPLPALLAAVPLPALLLAVLLPPPLLPQPAIATSAVAINIASGMRVQVRRRPWRAFSCRLMSSVEDTVKLLRRQSPGWASIVPTLTAAVSAW
jgi:hypothetical protein